MASSVPFLIILLGAAAHWVVLPDLLSQREVVRSYVVEVPIDDLGRIKEQLAPIVGVRVVCAPHLIDERGSKRAACHVLVRGDRFDRSTENRVFGVLEQSLDHPDGFSRSFLIFERDKQTGVHSGVFDLLLAILVLGVSVLLVWLLIAMARMKAGLVPSTDRWIPDYRWLVVANAAVFLSLPMLLVVVPHASISAPTDAGLLISPLLVINVFNNLVSSLIIAPIVEEIFFRKWALDYSHGKGLQVLVLLFSALMWTLGHQGRDDLELVRLFIGGVILGFIYMQTRSFALVVLLHVAHNALMDWQWLSGVIPMLDAAWDLKLLKVYLVT